MGTAGVECGMEWCSGVVEWSGGVAWVCVMAWCGGVEWFDRVAWVCVMGRVVWCGVAWWYRVVWYRVVWYRVVWCRVELL